MNIVNISSNSVFLNTGETDFIVTFGALNVNAMSSNVVVVASPILTGQVANTEFAIELTQINANNVVSNTYLQSVLNTFSTSITSELTVIENEVDWDGGLF